MDRNRGPVTESAESQTHKARKWASMRISCTDQGGLDGEKEMNTSMQIWLERKSRSETSTQRGKLSLRTALCRGLLRTC